MSKLKHENMEQDVLLEYSSRFVHYYRNNKAVVWGALIGLILVIGLIIGYFILNSQKESEAENLLGQAEEFYMAGDFETALFGDDGDFTPGFVQIADNYRRTRAGNLSAYYAAVTYFELDELEEARAYMERFEVPGGIMGVGPLSLHAVILSELGEYEASGEKFKEAADWDMNNRTTPHNLLESAVAFEAAGNPDRAMEQLEIILTDYPDSPQYADAQRMKGRLSAGQG